MAGTSKTTIMDLETNCLRKIGSFLGRDDIVNVAMAFHLTDDNVLKLKEQRQTQNSHQQRSLLRSAETIRELFLVKNGKAYKLNDLEHYEHYEEYNVSVLTHFGSLLSHLEIEYEYMEPEERKTVDNAILSNCTDSLESIKLYNVDKNTLASICKPFANVTKVDINYVEHNSYLGEKLSRFNQWFPRMEELRLAIVEFEKLECLEHHFPNLKHLAIDTDSEWYDVCSAHCEVVTDSNLKILLDRNPQLERSELNDNGGGRDGFGVCLSPKFLSFIARKLPNLRDLTLQIQHLDYEPSRVQGIIHFKRLSSLNISVSNLSFLSKFSIKSSQLLTLTLESGNTGTWETYESVSKFIKKMNNLKSLTIKRTHKEHDLYAKYVIDLVSSVQHLESFEIGFDWRRQRAADAIVYFITNCKQIKKITCKITDSYIPAEKLTNIQQKFIASFNGCTENKTFDTTGWNIKFKGSKTVSISKLN